MKVSFARQVKEEVVFNDFDICCQKAILSAIIKVNGTLSLSNQGLLLTIRTENAKIASKVHKMLKEVYHPHIEFLVSRKMKLQKNNNIKLAFGLFYFVIKKYFFTKIEVNSLNFNKRFYIINVEIE